MSEKQAKRKKRESAENSAAVSKDKSSILANIITVFIILAVLCLGVYAVGSKYMNNSSSETADNTHESDTVADYIAENGMTFDEFKAEYGLEDNSGITEDTAVESAASSMTLDNYAKYTDTTLEELKSQYGLGDDVPDTTLWQDAMEYMTTGTVAHNIVGVDFDTLKSQMGLPDSVTEDTLWSETRSIMSELYQQNEAEHNENSEDSAETPATDEAAGE